MATSGSKTGSAGYAGFYVRADWARTASNIGNNTSTVRLRLYLIVPGGSSVTATETGSVTLDGSTSSYNNGSQYRAAGTHLIKEYSKVITHDVNGNKTFSYSGTFTSGWSSLGTINTGTGSGVLDRLPLAPTISSVLADTITPTTVRLRAETSSYGHGTSNTWTMYYRLQGSGTWISAGSQADGSGYNNWPLTGLKPGKTYEYYVKAVNNNGDTVNSSTYTFKTKGVAGLAPLLMALLQR